MVRCIKIRRYEKNTLRGFVDLELPHVGLILRDCTWHARDDQEWVSFFTRSYEGNDGATHWMPVIEFAAGARQARQQFQNEAIAAIDNFIEQDRGSAS
jgi:hypothetical protein